MRETILLEDDNRKNAEILAASISTALKDNMLGGRPEETVRILKELSGMKGVEEIAVLNPDGSPAFGMRAPALELNADISETILKGDEAAFLTAESQYFIKPLINKKQCRSCHTDNGKPVGDFALKLGDCFKCRVYKELHGDELRQLIDKFNKMSLSLKAHKENVKMHIEEIERINREFTKSNPKLNTLLEASRLTTSTLKLDEILSASLKIILNVTNLKTGIILLLEEDLDKKCYEFFDCNVFNCPTYKAALNCWRLSGTMCHSGDTSACPFGSTAISCWKSRHIHTHYTPAKKFDEKINSCSNCEFFANIVLIPKMVEGFKDGRFLGKKVRLDSTTIQKARIIGIADTWDAMLSDRPYRKALSIEEAKNELKKHSGVQFDPEIVDAFVKVLESE